MPSLEIERDRERDIEKWASTAGWMASVMAISWHGLADCVLFFVIIKCKYSRWMRCYRHPCSTLSACSPHSRCAPNGTQKALAIARHTAIPWLLWSRLTQLKNGMHAAVGSNSNNPCGTQHSGSSCKVSRMPANGQHFRIIEKCLAGGPTKDRIRLQQFDIVHATGHIEHMWLFMRQSNPYLIMINSLVQVRVMRSMQLITHRCCRGMNRTRLEPKNTAWSYAHCCVACVCGNVPMLLWNCIWEQRKSVIIVYSRCNALIKRRKIIEWHVFFLLSHKIIIFAWPSVNQRALAPVRPTTWNNMFS